MLHCPPEGISSKGPKGVGSKGNIIDVYSILFNLPFLIYIHIKIHISFDSVNKQYYILHIQYDGCIGNVYLLIANGDLFYKSGFGFQAVVS